jgi:hypothetical protein
MEGIRSRNPLAAVCGSLAIPIFPQRRCSFFVTHFAEPLGSQAASVCHSPSCVNCYVRTRTLLQFGETYLRVAVVAQRIYRIHFQCPRPRASTEARHSHSNPVVPLPQCFFRTRCPTPEDGTKGLPIFRMSIPASVTARGNLLFVHGTTLLSEPFDPARIQLSSDPVTLRKRSGQTSMANAVPDSTQSLQQLRRCSVRDGTRCCPHCVIQNGATPSCTCAI